MSHSPCWCPALDRGFAALMAFFQGGKEICCNQEQAMRRRQTVLDRMNSRYDSDSALWAYVRSRLEVKCVRLYYFFVLTKRCHSCHS